MRKKEEEKDPIRSQSSEKSERLDDTAGSCRGGYAHPLAISGLLLASLPGRGPAYWLWCCRSCQVGLTNRNIGAFGAATPDSAIQFLAGPANLSSLMMLVPCDSISFGYFHHSLFIYTAACEVPCLFHAPVLPQAPGDPQDFGSHLGSWGGQEGWKMVSTQEHLRLEGVSLASAAAT